MLGQLHDAGNTTTLAHYLRLLETAFLVSGLPMFTRGVVRKRASSPKLVLWNNALATSSLLPNFSEARADGELWGRLVENAVGAHLLNHLHGPAWSISYWRDGDDEVDFVVNHGQKTWAIEVKSTRMRPSRGLEKFLARYPKTQPVIVGAGGVALETFFAGPPSDVLGGSRRNL
jgi:predicted AAA+ superfamily ATPase